MTRNRRTAFLAIQVLLALACLYAAWQLASRFDLKLLAASWPWIGLLVVAWALNQAVCAWRLRVLLGVLDIVLPYLEVLRLTLSSFIAASVLPGVVAGDIAKIALVKLSTRDVRLSDIAIVALIDRVLGFLSLWMLSFILSFAVAAPEGGVAGPLIQFARAGFVLTVIALIVMVLGARTLALAVERWSPRLPRRVVAVAHVLFRVLRDGKALRTILFAAVPISLLAVVVLVSIQAFVGGWIMVSLGRPAAVLPQAFLAPVSIVVSSLPIVPAGIGVGQLSLSASYRIMNLAAEAALTLTSLVQIAQIGLSCALAWFVLRLRGKSA
jgi:uncharacterized membrane protein YbhN (UPF0104 family)